MNRDSVLWIIYRAKFGTNPDTISFVASGSKDGINWSKPADFFGSHATRSQV